MLNTCFKYKLYIDICVLFCGFKNYCYLAWPPLKTVMALPLSLSIHNIFACASLYCLYYITL